MGKLYRGTFRTRDAPYQLKYRSRIPTEFSWTVILRPTYGETRKNRKSSNQKIEKIVEIKTTFRRRIRRVQMTVNRNGLVPIHLDMTRRKIMSKIKTKKTSQNDGSCELPLFRLAIYLLYIHVYCSFRSVSKVCEKSKSAVRCGSM